MFCPKCGIENPDNGKFCRGCGANLTNVLAVVNGEFIAENGAIVENNPDEIYSKGIRNAIIGTGFELVGFLLFTMPGNTFYWLIFLIAGFCVLANGVMQIMRATALKKARDSRANTVLQPTLSGNQPINALPPSQTEYVSPVSSYTTKDLVVPSVTEETTKHLKAENKNG